MVHEPEDGSEINSFDARYFKSQRREKNVIFLSSLNVKYSLNLISLNSRCTVLICLD